MPFILPTLVTLLAFAANSLHNRGALQYELIGPGELTILRVAFGALTLFLTITWNFIYVLPITEVTVGALARLLVPTFALILGALFLQEVVNPRTTLSAVLIVGGLDLGCLLKGRPPFQGFTLQQC